MTYRERREAKAERLREWSGKREVKAKEAFDRSSQIASGIPMGQPILVGHHSERRHRRDVARIESGMVKGIEHTRKAEDFDRRAKGIDHQLEVSIYSDDSDAIEKLEERIADLEAERDRVKRYNATARKGTPDFSIITEREKASLLSALRAFGGDREDRPVFPSYHLSNLSGNITRNRKRLAQLKAEREGGER